MNKKIINLSKTLLLLTTAIFFTLVVFNNLTDYNSNYQFVKHVLSMDTTFQGNNLMWRAITNTTIHDIFYWIIIIAETIIAIFLWVATIKGFKFYKTKKFYSKLNSGIIGLTLALLLWFFAFITIGGEWFAMWQSDIWNGQDSAFRMFAINGITLLFLLIKNK